MTHNPEKKVCMGSCGETIPAYTAENGGQYTESTRTICHHPGGECHYLGKHCYIAPTPPTDTVEKLVEATIADFNFRWPPRAMQLRRATVERRLQGDFIRAALTKALTAHSSQLRERVEGMLLDSARTTYGGYPEGYNAALSAVLDLLE